MRIGKPDIDIQTFGQLRLMVCLLYLKHAYNESDESVCERWTQDAYFQFFCGE
jgi:transposase, IS5 family